MEKWFTLLLFVLTFSNGYSQYIVEEAEVEKGVWEISPSSIYSYAPSLSKGLFKTELHVTYWINEEWAVVLIES